MKPHEIQLFDFYTPSKLVGVTPPYIIFEKGGERWCQHVLQTQTCSEMDTL